MDIKARLGLPEASDPAKLAERLKYPETLHPKDLRVLYDRNLLASALVNARVDASWGDASTFLVDDEEDEQLNAIARESRVLDALQRADLRSEVTTWSIFIPGASGEPAVWGADEAVIEERDQDGMPRAYSVAPSGLSDEEREKQKRIVRANQVAHVCDPRYSASVLTSNPRIVAGYNRLFDLERIMGGGAFAIFQAGFPQYHFMFEGVEPTEKELNELKQQMDEFADAVRKVLTTTEGVSMDTVNVNVPSVSPALREYLVHIVAGFGVPMSEFTGEALVAHSASVNLTTWHKRMNRRRSRMILPRVVEPCLARFIEVRGIDYDISRLQDVTLDWTEHGDTPTTSDLTAQSNAIISAVREGIADTAWALEQLPEQWFGPVDQRMPPEEPEEDDEETGPVPPELDPDEDEEGDEEDDAEEDEDEE